MSLKRKSSGQVLDADAARAENERIRQKYFVVSSRHVVSVGLALSWDGFLARRHVSNGFNLRDWPWRPMVDPLAEYA